METREPGGAHTFKRDLPAIGQDSPMECHIWHSKWVPECDLVRRVAQSTGLTEGEAARIVADVVAYYSEPAPAYVRRRHARLKLQGRKNAEIFAQVRSELSRRVVAPPELSDRQLRRIVYG